MNREQVLAYRWKAQGLGRDGELGVLSVLTLGIPDTPYGSARAALAMRMDDAPAEDADGYTLAWTFRGAPHLHRTEDIPHLAKALWPASDADATSRLVAERKPLKEAGIGGLEAFETAAKAMRKVVKKAMPKGEVSAGVTRELPKAYSYECRGCEATHVYGGLFQQVGLPGGVRLVPGGKTTLTTAFDKYPLPKKAEGTDDVIRAYLRLHGPATLGEAAGYLGTSQAAAKHAWSEGGLADFELNGKQVWLPEDQLDALSKAKPGKEIRLIPPGDPYLQMRDRDLLVPERQRQKEIWRMLGNPGAVLVGPEVAGIWRSRLSGKKLTLTVQPFDGKIPVKALQAEAERLAAARGATAVDLA